MAQAGCPAKTIRQLVNVLPGAARHVANPGQSLAVDQIRPNAVSFASIWASIN